MEDGRARKEILRQGDCGGSYAVFWTFNILRQKCLSLLLVFACKIKTTVREFNRKFVMYLVLSSSRFHFLLAGVRLRSQKTYKHSWKYKFFFHHWSWNMCWFLILGWFKYGFIFFPSPLTANDIWKSLLGFVKHYLIITANNTTGWLAFAWIIEWDRQGSVECVKYLFCINCWIDRWGIKVKI